MKCHQLKYHIQNAKGDESPREGVERESIGPTRWLDRPLDAY